MTRAVLVTLIIVLGALGYASVRQLDHQYMREAV